MLLSYATSVKGAFDRLCDHHDCRTNKTRLESGHATRCDATPTLRTRKAANELVVPAEKLGIRVAVARTEGAKDVEVMRWQRVFWGSASSGGAALCRRRQTTSLPG
jgi:hypothetical protein